MILMPFGLDGWAFCGDGQGAVGDDRRRRTGSPSCRRSIRSDWFRPRAVIVLTIALVLATLPTTWLRARRVAGGAGRAGDRVRRARLPDAVVSEDGRLVAIRTADGALAVNRTRPNAFTTEDWQKALMAETVVKPTSIAADGLARPRPPIGDRFRCSRRCLPRHGPRAAPSSPTPPIAANARRFAPAPRSSSSTTRRPRTLVAPGAATVLTKRDLARRGSASVSFDDGSRRTGGRTSPSPSTSRIGPGTRIVPSRARRAACRPYQRRRSRDEAACGGHARRRRSTEPVPLPDTSGDMPGADQ